MFMVRQIKPAFFIAARDLNVIADNTIRLLKRTHKCGDQPILQAFEKRIENVIKLELMEFYSWCESKYNHWNIDTEQNYNINHRMLLKHMVVSCVETAKQIAIDRIHDTVWECFNGEEKKHQNI